MVALSPMCVWLYDELNSTQLTNNKLFINLYSNGQISPTAISPPPSIAAVSPLEHNNNKHVSSIVEENGVVPANYANVGVVDVGMYLKGQFSILRCINFHVFLETSSHVYMNVDAKEIINSLSQNSFTESREYQRELSEEVHCYANIDSRDVESLQVLQVSQPFCIVIVLQ